MSPFAGDSYETCKTFRATRRDRVRRAAGILLSLLSYANRSLRYDLSAARKETRKE